MLRERLKSSAILILMSNLIFLTSQLWFFNSTYSVSNEIIRSLRALPLVEKFFPSESEYSISKENLSRPRKFLINDGSLWMAYYNTDIGFSPIEQRTRNFLKALLNGDVIATQSINNETWESGLESLSIYAEYPIAFSIDMFCKIMGVNPQNSPTQIKSFREFIILPSDEENGVCILLKDASNEKRIFAYMLNSKHTLPSSDLSVYTSSDGYYEPAFSTGLELPSDSKVSLSSLVLFSDSQPETDVLSANNLLNEKLNKTDLLENFSFNSVAINPYEDTEGALTYIGNYSSIKIYPDSVLEYTAIEEDKGIVLDESGDEYNVLNASIDFAEKVWSSVCKEPLSILLTNDIANYDAAKPFTFKFDYYCHGRPMEVDLPSAYGHNRMNCAIEMTVSEGKLVSYKQYMRSYEITAQYTLSDTFVSALDNFVHILDKTVPQSPVIIEDIYIGYFDNGTEDEIHTEWLAEVSNDKIYRYSTKTEVANNELE